jgi:hypothetical protein
LRSKAPASIEPPTAVKPAVAARGHPGYSLAFPLVALIALALIGLSMVWPQGQGARSPAPFGHEVAPVKPPATAPAPDPVQPGAG